MYKDKQNLLLSMNCYLIFLEYQIKFALDKGQPSGFREGGGGEIKAQRNTGTRPRKAKTRPWTLSQSIWRSWLRRWRLLKMVPWKTDGEAPEDGAMKNWQGGSLRRCHEKLKDFAMKKWRGGSLRHWHVKLTWFWWIGW